MKRVGVRILLKDEVLDTQGRAVQGVLKNSGFKVGDVKVGKFIIVNVETANDAEAVQQASKMAESFLHNPLIERFEVEVLK